MSVDVRRIVLSRENSAFEVRRRDYVYVEGVQRAHCQISIQIAANGNLCNQTTHTVSVSLAPRSGKITL